MNKKYSINKVGRHMPYKVEDKFFDDLERDISAKLGIDIYTAPQKRYHKNVFKIVSITTLAVAASVVLFLLFKPTINSAIGIKNLEQAYISLCEEDQSFLMEVYYNDIFLHQQ